MKRTHKFRLYPNNEQVEKLERTLELCRQMYNMLLGQLNKWNNLSKYEAQSLIVDIKACHPEFKKVYSKVLQMVNYRLFSNLKALSKKKKRGYKVGRMRFKGKGWFKTFTYNQSGFKIIPTGNRCQTLHLSKIGDIRIRCHRNIKGKVKQVTIKRERSGKWYAYFVEERNVSIPKKNINKAVGIDVGLDNFVYDSGGKYINNPRLLKKYERRLKHLQKKLSRKEKGSNNWHKAKIRVAKQHEKVRNIRKDFIHKVSRYYVNMYDAIGLEDMKMTVKNNRYAKSRLDVAWGKLRQYIHYKAESAGGVCKDVDHRGTSQECYKCGKKVEKELWDRRHSCPHCGFDVDRDYNSALVIHQRLLDDLDLADANEVGQGLSESKLVETPLTAELDMRSTSHVSSKQEASSLGAV